MPTQHTTFCRICESLCGLEVTVEDNQVLDIRPDNRHVATQGFACKKGLRQHHLYGSPDRLTHPLRHGVDGLQPIDWATANSEIGSKLRRIVAEHGTDAVAMYVGTAAGFGVLHPVFGQGFMEGLGSRNMYASATQDCANKFAVAERMYGFPFAQPFPDLLHTKLLIVVGANPMVSKWSFLQVPNPRKHINDIKSSGGRVVIIDPRKTETAKAAGEHLFIKPGTDAYFFLGFLGELIRQGGIDDASVKEFANDFDIVQQLSESVTLQHTSELTGIPADTMQALVSAYRTADGAAIYSSTGVNMGPNGGIAFWLQEVINMASGNLDRKGGTLVGEGIIDFLKFGKQNNLLVKDDRSRIGGFRKTNDAYPGGILADEILTPGEGQIRALIVTGGNPLLTMADGDKLAHAFDQLELLVTLDILPTETASASHYVLPCTSPLERPDLPFIFPLMLGMQTRPYLQATEAVLTAPGEARDEATIYADLAHHAGINLFGSRIFQWLVRASLRINQLGGDASVPQRFWLSLLLRLCGQGGFKRWLGHGKLRAENTGNNFLGKRVYTESERVELAPPELVKQLNRLLASDVDADPLFPFKMITKREIATHNSWTHNYEAFLRSDADRNFVFMHPADAERLQLADGQLAHVTSQAGRIRLPVQTSEDLAEGVVAVPHGWGHQNSGQQVAKQSRGVNVNLLASSGVDHVDAFSGMSQLTAIPVSVQPANTTEVAANWSGLG